MFLLYFTKVAFENFAKAFVRHLENKVKKTMFEKHGKLGSYASLAHRISQISEMKDTDLWKIDWPERWGNVFLCYFLKVSFVGDFVSFVELRIHVAKLVSK